MRRVRGVEQKKVTFNLKENETPKTNHSSITPPRSKKKQPKPHSVVARQRKQENKEYDSNIGIEKTKRIPTSRSNEIRPVQKLQIQHKPTTTEQAQKINMCSNVSIKCDLTNSNGNKAMRDEEGDETIKHAQLRQATIDGTIPTAIADSGASLTCLKVEQQQVSKCGKYRWKPPFKSTGERSNKVFAMALGNTAAASEIVCLDALPL